MIGARQVIYAEQCFFIEAQVAGDGANKPVAKHATGRLRPVFVFEGFDKTGADAGGLGEFIHRDFAKLALALETFTKISLGHEAEPVPEDASAMRRMQQKKSAASLNGL